MTGGALHVDPLDRALIALSGRSVPIPPVTWGPSASAVGCRTYLEETPFGRGVLHVFPVCGERCYCGTRGPWGSE